MILALSAAVMFALVMWMLISVRGQSLFKALICLSIIFFSLGIMVAGNSLRGWAVDDELPEKYVLYSIAKKDEFAYISLSITPDDRSLFQKLFEIEPDYNNLRTYKIPMDMFATGKFEQIRERLKSGPVILQFKRGSNQGNSGFDGSNNFGPLGSPIPIRELIPKDR
jgi:hypothetical protein